MSRFIEIRGAGAEGLGHLNRVWIKREMEQFGEVMQVHKPPSAGDPETDIALVRFAKEESAQMAVDTFKSGTVLIKGTPIIADWKGNQKGKGRSSGVVDFNTRSDDSRALALGRDRRQSRSRSRQGGSSRGDDVRGGGSRGDDNRDSRGGNGRDSRGGSGNGRGDRGGRRDDSRDRSRRDDRRDDRR